MKPRILFVPADDAHIPQYNQFVNSVRKFHTEEELPIVRITQPNPPDPDFWYRAKPIIANELLNEYETVIGADADQIVLAPINDIWEGDFDVAVVRNDPSYPIQVWDITHPNYPNNGLVVIKSKEFAKHWLKLCMSEHFSIYQYREQDLLAILCNYGNYDIKVLDDGYGEASKPYWTQFEMKDGKVMFNYRQLFIYHSGGGANDPSKGNFSIRFKPEVVNYINTLIK